MRYSLRISHFPSFLRRQQLGAQRVIQLGGQKEEKEKEKRREMGTENTWLPQNLRAEIGKMSSLSSFHMISRWSDRICSNPLSRPQL